MQKKHDREKKKLEIMECMIKQEVKKKKKQTETLIIIAGNKNGKIAVTF